MTARFLSLGAYQQLFNCSHRSFLRPLTTKILPPTS